MRLTICLKKKKEGAGPKEPTLGTQVSVVLAGYAFQAAGHSGAKMWLLKHPLRNKIWGFRQLGAQALGSGRSSTSYKIKLKGVSGSRALRH